MKFILGSVLIVFALIVFGGTFYPIIQQEVDYRTNSAGTNVKSDKKTETPVDTDFGIVISKIGANSHVIKDVNPFDSKEYQLALTRGVAHAKGSALPGQMGNIFLFSHSSSDFLNATKYNSIFYLLTKLEAGDQIKLYFEGEEFLYEVKNKETVSSEAVEYLNGTSNVETLTLMTCWPPGTSIKRLIIQAIRK